MRWGLIGVGSETAIAYRRALRTLKLLEKEDRVQVWAVCSRTNFEFARQVAEEAQIPRAYQFAEEIFADRNVEAVYIGTLPTTHRMLVEDALLAGKHVFVEKPVVFSKEDAARLRGMVKRSDRRFAINHTWLASPFSEQSFRDLLALPQLGHQHVIEIYLAAWGKWMDKPMDWHWDRSQGGGAGWDLMSHAVSIAWSITGMAPVPEWQVTMLREGSLADHAMRAMGRTWSGTRLDLRVEWVPTRDQIRGHVQIRGSERDLLIDGLTTDGWRVSGHRGMHTYASSRDRWWRTMFLDFMGVVGRDRQPLLMPELSIAIDEAVSTTHRLAQPTVRV